jgi:hypothetical protein
MPDKKELVDYRAALKAELEATRETTAPPGGNRIKLNAQKQFELPDGTVSGKPLEAIILDYRSLNTFYEGIYNPKDIKAPVCAAVSKTLANLVPVEEGTSIQADSCNVCPQNEWGSGNGNGKACKNGKRVAVMAVDGTEALILNVSPTGTGLFDKYINSLAAIGKTPMEVITSITFDPNVAYAKLNFEVGDGHDSMAEVMAARTAIQATLDASPIPVEKVAATA